MRLLGDTNINFMKYRKFWIFISLVLIAVFFFAFFFIHLNLGIDFAGGTQITLRFRDRPQVDRLRSMLAEANLGAEEIQRFGAENQNEVMVKTAVTKGSEEGSRERVVAAFNRRFNQGEAGKLDLNQSGADGIIQLLAAADPDHLGAAAAAPPAGAPGATANPPASSYSAVADALMAQRRKTGLFGTWDEVAHTPGLSPAALAAFKQRAFLGDYAVLAVENVGPQIGKELSRQGLWAVGLSLAGMLAYIGLRFELRFGIGAVMASIHDVLITLGLFILMKFEFNLTTIAAFLTLVGYSTNDTVVIFDRMRENMRKNRRKPLIEVMNESINQTLSRTIMTSGLTMLSVAALLALGGDVLRGFAFVMTIGIIVGTYSSVYIASPFALLWEQLFGAKSRIRGDASQQAAASRLAGPPQSAAARAKAAGTASAGGGARGANRASAAADRQSAAAPSDEDQEASTLSPSPHSSQSSRSQQSSRSRSASRSRRSGRR